MQVQPAAESWTPDNLLLFPDKLGTQMESPQASPLPSRPPWVGNPGSRLDLRSVAFVTKRKRSEMPSVEETRGFVRYICCIPPWLRKP